MHNYYLLSAVTSVTLSLKTSRFSCLARSFTLVLVSGLAVLLAHIPRTFAEEPTIFANTWQGNFPHENLRAVGPGADIGTWPTENSGTHL
jgi:hypothetical protein